MTRLLLPLASFLLASIPTFAAPADVVLPAPGEPLDLLQFMDLDESEPDVDPYRIINESLNFRKDREPDMTAAEFALYERIATMVETNPGFALQLLETMLHDEQEDSAAFDLALGNFYYNEGRTEEAMTRYHSAVTKYPEFLRAWGNIGTLHYEQESWHEAASAFAKAVNLGDRDAQTFGLLAYSLRQSGNTLGAEMAFQQAMTANPEDPNWIGGLLELYLANGRHAQCETLVREMVRLQPDNPRHWMLYASLLVNLERPLEAATQLETARMLGVSNVETLKLLGDLYTRLGLVPEAIAAYRDIPGEDQALGAARLIAYVRSQISQGELEKAAQALATIPISTDWAQVRAHRFAEAELATARSEWEEAEAAYRGILQTEPLNGYALLGLGQTLNSAGDRARAQFAFESALQVEISKRHACLELANLALHQRDIAEALQYLHQADKIESSPAIRSQIARLSSLAGTSTP
jgi:tetratricopeptide (TPR) repeat protein